MSLPHLRSFLLTAAAALGLALPAHAAFESWIPLDDYVRTALEEGSAFRAELPTPLGPVPVAFTRTSVRHTDYHAESVVGNRRRGRPSPQVHHYTGELLVDATRGDFARLSFAPRQGRVHGLARVDGQLFDLSANLRGGDFVLHVAEVTAEQVRGVAASCGLTASESLLAEPATASGSTAVGEPSTAAAGALREIELGTEADAPFVSQLGGVDAANARIQSIVNAMNGVYEADLGLTNRIVVQRAWSGSDPYTTSDSGELLRAFRSQFLANVATVYDDAQLFSGRDFESSTVGRAWVSSACSDWRFGVNQYYNRNDLILQLIVSHELGHNLGAGHTTDGLMTPSLSTNQIYFNGESQSEIGGYLQSGGSCIEAGSGGGGQTPPTLEPVGPQSVGEGGTLGLQLRASDPDGGTITFGATPLPVGATLSADGRFDYVPPRDTVGCGGSKDVTILFTATDPQGNQASESVPITVRDGASNAAPALADPADRSASVGQTVSLQLSAPDPDGDSVSFSSPNLPAGASLTGSGAFTWTPASDQVGNHTVRFTAWDCSGNSASQDVVLTVDPLAAPHLDRLSHASRRPGSPLKIFGSNLAGSRIRVTIDGVRARVRRANNVRITVTVPDVPAQRAAVVEVVRDGVPADNTLTVRIRR